ncbi:hypothetical protein CC86DRAFT_421941 [Ophiobolus disseminans]|uniref:Uncharacterized protein n=1 Tax=Ophiobolus disseminans TaxID=1469910 RepID=A0A6A6ZQ23_9PLEO|nr:hypothetical protein CC86DRAFT_421941 [Ophiobolus disseminans]
MPSSKSRSGMMFVHHQLTGEIEVRRSDEFTKNTKTSLRIPKRHFHYTDKHRSHVCRCTSPNFHEQSSPVASDSTHLSACLTRFLDLHHLDACSMTEFRAYTQNQQTEWIRDGVQIDDFHYATKQKDVVCRCSAPNNHGQGSVRNPDIIELCAKFFRLCQGKMTCTKAQWRTIVKELSASGRNPPSHLRYAQDSPFEDERYSLDDTPLHTLQLDKTQSCDAPKIVPDIPRQVWANARPSVYRSGSATSSSTPLGSPITPHSPASKHDCMIYGPRPSVVRLSSQISTVKTWSTVQREATGEAIGDSAKTLQYPLATPGVGPALEVSIPLNSIIDAQDRNGRLLYNPWNSDRWTRQVEHTRSPSRSEVSSEVGSSMCVPSTPPRCELPAEPVAELSALKSPSASSITELHTCRTPVQTRTRQVPSEAVARRPSFKPTSAVDLSAWEAPIERRAPRSAIELPTHEYGYIFYKERAMSAYSSR